MAKYSVEKTEKGKFLIVRRIKSCLFDWLLKPTNQPNIAPAYRSILERNVPVSVV